jgi:hypothetical protein
LAHRVAWTLHHGQIPDGMSICHHCDNPPCVRPDHLFVGTHGDNCRDKISKGREAHVRGSENGQAKLTEAEVLQIRALAPTMLQQQIADKFGISRKQIWAIVHRKKWAHLP